MFKLNFFGNFSKVSLICIAFLFSASVTAQDGIPILPFEEGKILSNDDINFLNLVINDIGSSAESRGPQSQVRVGDSVLRAGVTLSEAQASQIQEILKGFEESDGDVTRGAADQSARGAYWCGYCCYYYWWSNRCRCYLYRYYYCCAC